MDKCLLAPYTKLKFGEGVVQTKVLVVDDDVEMTELLKILLAPNGFDVFAANNVVDGIDAVRRLKPDVMILDLVMPGMDGWQVCKEIRKSSQVPILILSVIDKPGMIARALDEGADDYLLKPVTSSVLTAHLRRLARRALIESNHNGAAFSLGA
jgi:DNA-binding response OmpR family regulator